MQGNCPLLLIIPLTLTRPTKTPTSLALHFLSAGFSYGSHRFGRHREGDQRNGSELQQEGLFFGEIGSTSVLPTRGVKREPDAANHLGLQRLTLSGKLGLPGLRQLLAFLSVGLLAYKHQNINYRSLAGGFAVTGHGSRASRLVNSCGPKNRTPTLFSQDLSL